MTSAIYESFGLDQTIHVDRLGNAVWGIDVPHEGANIQCGAPIGTRKDHETGIVYHLLCKKRAGHDTPKGLDEHVAVDIRVVASVGRVIHGRRFAPSGIPAGVDQSITAPHDCENHLDN